MQSLSALDRCIVGNLRALRSQAYGTPIATGVLQALVEQQLLTTQRTREVMLQLLPEGESAAAWERTLKALIASAAEDDEMNPVLWQELKAQVRLGRMSKCAWQECMGVLCTDGAGTKRALASAPVARREHCAGVAVEQEEGGSLEECPAAHRVCLPVPEARHRGVEEDEPSSQGALPRRSVCGSGASCMRLVRSSHASCMQAPFCVHPKTGKVCIPIDPQRSSNFDPDAVPKLEAISQELEVLGKVRLFL